MNTDNEAAYLGILTYWGTRRDTEWFHVISGQGHLDQRYPGLRHDRLGFVLGPVPARLGSHSTVVARTVGLPCKPYKHFGWLSLPNLCSSGTRCLCRHI